MITNQMRTINCNITYGVRPVFLILRLTVIFPQLPRKMPQDGIALGQGLPVQLDDWDSGIGVHFLNLALLVLGIFLKGVPDVFICDTSVFPHETYDLSAAAGGKVEIMHGGHSPNGFVGFARTAEFLGARHDEGRSG